jgi:hypothetical protein
MVDEDGRQARVTIAAVTERPIRALKPLPFGIEQGIYLQAEAALLAGLPPTTVRRWLQLERGAEALAAVAEQPLLSFLDLVSLRAVAALRHAGLSSQTIRKGANYMRAQLGINYPLASEALLTDGVHLYFRGDGPLLAVDIGRMLQTLYPDTVFVCGYQDAPAKSEKDPALYRWCRDHDAILVTGDFNMVRDQAILGELLKHEGLRVIWIRQIRGQTADREAIRVVGRWTHVRQSVTAESTIMGFVLRGTGQLRRYTTISDTVYEVLPARRRRIQAQ